MTRIRKVKGKTKGNQFPNVLGYEFGSGFVHVSIYVKNSLQCKTYNGILEYGNILYTNFIIHATMLEWIIISILKFSGPKTYHLTGESECYRIIIYGTVDMFQTLNSTSVVTK